MYCPEEKGLRITVWEERGSQSLFLPPFMSQASGCLSFMVTKSPFTSFSEWWCNLHFHPRYVPATPFHIYPFFNGAVSFPQVTHNDVTAFVVVESSFFICTIWWPFSFHLQKFSTYLLCVIWTFSLKVFMIMFDCNFCRCGTRWWDDGNDRRCCFTRITKPWCFQWWQWWSCNGCDYESFGSRCWSWWTSRLFWIALAFTLKFNSSLYKYTYFRM